MSECTTCSYYGKHLEGRSEDMPWPCVDCAGGEKYVERGKRRHQIPLRVQLAALLTRHNALVIEHAALLINNTALREAVAWERECTSDDIARIHSDFIYNLGHLGLRYVSQVQAELFDIQEHARTEVGSLLQEET